ncbi:MAG: HDOD domain-containing protein [Fibrobacteria bacterium]|nr:HDOD domain-containing protein [Fibrobacteria bacterium]
MTTATVPDKFKAIVEGLGQVPTLPAIAARALEILNQPNASADQAARLIGQDLALSAKVLRLANSAFYGIPRTISSVDQAIVILGFQTVRSLVMSASVMKILGRGAKGSLDRRGVWRHSVAAALAARLLARKLGRRMGLDTEALFMAGLLHKIGVMILDSAVQAEYESVLREAAQEGAQPLPAIERAVLGTDHGALGGMLCERWGLPDELREPIASHINPAEATSSREQAAIIHLASHLAEVSGFVAFVGFGQWPVDTSVLEILGLTPLDIPELGEALRSELEKAEGFFALIDQSM